MTKRILCVLSALMLAAALMTGCGTQTENVADTEVSDQIQEETVPSETTAELTETSPAETDTTETVEAAPEEDENLAAARRVLEAFMDALVNGDADALFEGTDLTEKMAGMYGAEDSDSIEEGFRLMKEELSEAAEIMQSYEIGAGRMDAEGLAAYNEGVEQLWAEAEEYLPEADEQERAEIETILLFASPADGLCVFPVTVVYTDGDEGTADVILYRIDGEWSVEMLLMEAVWADTMLSYVETSKTTAANTAAKTVFLAVNTALVDLDTEGKDLSLLEGDFALVGGELSGLNRSGALSEAEAEALKKYITLYFPDITEVGTASFRIEDGVCIATAVLRLDMTIGTYPHPAREDSGLQNVEQALSYAVNGTA